MRFLIFTSKDRKIRRHSDRFLILDGQRQKKKKYIRHELYHKVLSIMSLKCINKCQYLINIQFDAIRGMCLLQLVMIHHTWIVLKTRQIIRWGWGSKIQINIYVYPLIIKDINLRETNKTVIVFKKKSRKGVLRIFKIFLRKIFHFIFDDSQQDN